MIRLRDIRGLHYLAQLLGNPGLEFHASDLVTLHRGAETDIAHHDPDLRVVIGLGDVGELLDPRARAAYRARRSELAEEIEDSERHQDLGSLARAREEQHALLMELGAANGQRSATHAERTRVAVTKAIKAAIDRIGERHEPLCAHLAATIRLGYFCA